MRNGTLVAAMTLSGLLGAAAGLVLAAGAPERRAPATVVPAPDYEVVLEAAQARRERDVAREEVDALRSALERERAAARGPQVAGAWLHSVDGNGPQTLEMRHGGELAVGDFRARWTLEGRLLRLSWPDPSAPGGSWEDLCVVSEDGARYEGRNQIGSHIKGSRRRN
ncbi:MAG TPA: hypothetical protein VFS92_02040 [Planctomycetota bacterium]|nr:hypothetical protein [Planctomycetota bacterium]